MKTASKSLNNSRVYFCSVPIGNDDDITIRVKQQLHITPTIACEDTRVTKQLLKRLGIWQNQSLIRLDQHTENNQNWAWLASALLLGPVSVVSDAGTPGINDPGAKCMAHCIAHHIPIELLPGVSALTAIMTLSTRPITNLSFKGFFPRQHAQIIDAITWTVQQQCHCVWFESPKRLLKTIQQIATQTPSAQLTLAKELTKPHQKILDLLYTSKIPIFMVEEDAFSIATKINHMIVKIRTEDKNKIAIAESIIETYVDVDQIFSKMDH